MKIFSKEIKKVSMSKVFGALAILLMLLFFGLNNNALYIMSPFGTLTNKMVVINDELNSNHLEFMNQYVGLNGIKDKNALILLSIYVGLIHNSFIFGPQFYVDYDEFAKFVKKVGYEKDDGTPLNCEDLDSKNSNDLKICTKAFALMNGKASMMNGNKDIRNYSEKYDKKKQIIDGMNDKRLNVGNYIGDALFLNERLKRSKVSDIEISNICSKTDMLKGKKIYVDQDLEENIFKNFVKYRLYTNNKLKQNNTELIYNSILDKELDYYGKNPKKLYYGDGKGIETINGENISNIINNENMKYYIGDDKNKKMKQISLEKFFYLYSMIGFQKHFGDLNEIYSTKVDKDEEPELYITLNFLLNSSNADVIGIRNFLKIRKEVFKSFKDTTNEISSLMKKVGKDGYEKLKSNEIFILMPMDFSKIFVYDEEKVNKIIQEDDYLKKKGIVSIEQLIVKSKTNNELKKKLNQIKYKEFKNIGALISDGNKSLLNSFYDKYEEYIFGGKTYIDLVNSTKKYEDMINKRLLRYNSKNNGPVYYFIKGLNDSVLGSKTIGGGFGILSLIGTYKAYSVNSDEFKRNLLMFRGDKTFEPIGGMSNIKIVNLGGIQNLISYVKKFFISFDGKAIKNMGIQHITIFYFIYYVSVILYYIVIFLIGIIPIFVLLFVLYLIYKAFSYAENIDE